MAAAVPEYDFLKCATPHIMRTTNPTDPAIGELARVGVNVAGLVYATHPTNALLAYVLLSGGYGQTVPALSTTNAISQGDKIYMVDAAGTGRPTYGNVTAGAFVGYALPANEADAAVAILVPAGGTGDIMVWFRPE